MTHERVERAPTAASGPRQSAPAKRGPTVASRWTGPAGGRGAGHSFAELAVEPPAAMAAGASSPRRVVQPKSEIKLPKGKLKVTLDDSSGITFYRLDPKYAKEAYIYERALSYDPKEKCFVVKDAMLERQIDEFLTGGLTVYRGVPRWHATWYDLLDGDPITPLGSGRTPDFSTNDTIFIPFTADEAVAKRAAISRTGMGAKDDVRFVYGYNKGDPFEIGLVVSTRLDRRMPAGFFNASEVQVGGPVTDYRIVERFKMGDRYGKVAGYEGPNALKKLSEFFDEPPDEQELLDYLGEFKGLLHDPNLRLDLPPKQNRLAIRNAWKSLSREQQQLLLDQVRNLSGPLPPDEEVFGIGGASIRDEDL